MARTVTPRTRKNHTRADSVVPEITGLRRRGLSYRAIAEAIGFFRGITLSEAQVEYALAREGEPPRAQMARPRS